MGTGCDEVKEERQQPPDCITIFGSANRPSSFPVAPHYPAIANRVRVRGRTASLSFKRKPQRHLLDDVSAFGVRLTLTMARPTADYSLYLVTDSGLLPPGRSLVEQVERAIKGGVTIVQLREKKLAFEDFVKLGTWYRTAGCGIALTPRRSDTS